MVRLRLSLEREAIERTKLFQAGAANSRLSRVVDGLVMHWGLAHLIVPVTLAIGTEPQGHGMRFISVPYNY